MSNKFIRRFLLLILIINTTTVDGGRTLYLPLPKIHLSHKELKTTSNAQESVKHTDEFIPLSSLKSNIFEEQEEIAKRETFGWEALVDKEASANQRELDYLTSLDHEARVSNKVHNDEPWIADTAKSQLGRLQSDVANSDSEQAQRRNDALFLLIVGACSLVGVVGLVAAAIFWYRIQRRAETALESEYPSYGVNGSRINGSKVAPNSAVSDRKLAQSAQMFHYQQQRQQMMAQEKAHLDTKPSQSDDSDDETPHGGDYTVYECPGLAPTGEMEVRNPLFTEPESSSPTTTNSHYPQLSSTLPSSSSTQEKPSSSS